MSSGWSSRLPRTLGLRVALWYAAVFFVSVTAFVVITYVLLASSLQQRDREIVAVTLRAYAEEYARGGLRAVAAAVDREQRTGQRERLFVRVVSFEGEAVFMTLPPEWGRFAFDRLTDPDDAAWLEAPAADRPATLEVASARMRDGTLLQVGKSTEGRDDLLARFRQVLLLVTGIVLATGLVGGVLLTQSAMLPVRRLAATVRTIIATGRTDVRVETAGSADALDELGVLVNAMLDRITTLMQAKQASLDNVAHDLRTPLARLRGRAEEALASDDQETRAEALAGCIADSDHITAVLETLMDIAEARSGVMRLRLERTDLCALLHDVDDLYADAADDRGVALTVQCDDALRCLVDPVRLRRAVANLVDNAVKYTPAGGQVHVTAAREDGTVVVRVRDTGIGIEPVDIEHIWDRLYRADRSRSSQGLGLGLSVVRAFVEAHGGRVSVESTPGGGSTFTIGLPEEGPSAVPRSDGGTLSHL